nr:tetratricopeptide repeat-containing glycosyltransferase family protein [Bradyrhizobium sp. 179]
MTERTTSSAKSAFAEAQRLHGAGQFAEAEELLRNAVAEWPTDVSLRNARGVMFASMKRHVDAVWCYRDALRYDEGASGVWSNLGNSLTELNQLHSAISCHERAISHSSEKDPQLFHNLGVSLAEAGRHAEAVIAFGKALKLKPDYLAARWDRALSLLTLGNYSEAWPDYEVRKHTGQLPERNLPGKEWDGRAYSRRTLLLVSEQGFGDLIWMARYLPHVKALGGKLIIECRRELVPIIENMGVVDRVVLPGTEIDADLHAHICSIPSFFTTDFASIPSASYLVAQRERMTKLAPLFENGLHRLKVGIVWSGSVTFGKNHRRAQRLFSFLRACALPGVELYSLQKGPPVRELTSLPRGAPIKDLAPHLQDFADTAAAITHLDLVVMTDSSVAHLTGALGKPVWVLLGHNAHWLWLLSRVDSPWYPSMRLYRPRAEGDWDYVFDRVSADLMALADQRRPG